MYRYGKVIFKVGGEKGAKLQKILIERMAAQDVITAPKEVIEKWYEEDRHELVGCVHSYALHDKQETDIFKTIMESDEMQDPSVKWKISRFNHDREFTKWLEESQKWAEEDYRKTVKAMEDKKNGGRKKV